MVNVDHIDEIPEETVNLGKAEITPKSAVFSWKNFSI